MSRGDFWSRRKQKVAEERVQQDAAARAAEVEDKAREIEARSDEEILAEFGLPDPDTLQPGDAVIGFMKREIPERLRRRALRTLWRSNPVLACLDGLNDYDGDYTNAATDAPGVRTAYQVGRGLTRHVEEMARQSKAETTSAVAEGSNEATENPSHDCHESTEETTNSENYADLPEATQKSTNAAPASTTKVAMEQEGSPETVKNEDVVPRRMRFRFDTEI